MGFIINRLPFLLIGIICTAVVLAIGGSAYANYPKASKKYEAVGTFIPVIKIEQKHDGRVESTIWKMDTRTGSVNRVH